MVDRIDEPVTSVRATAPVRIDFAGGWSDVPVFAEQEGGVVVNAAISLRTHVDVVMGGRSIRLVARDLDASVLIPDATGIFYNGELDLHKAALNMMPVSGGVEITTRSDVPAGSGLGGSGSLDVALLAALAAAREEPHYDAGDFAEMGYLLEASELRLSGGRQDQYAAAFGGFNEFAFHDGPAERRPIDLAPTEADALRDCCTIVYTGESHFSSATHLAVWDAYANGDTRVTDAVLRIRDEAVAASEALHDRDWEALARAVGRNWACQQRLNPDIATERSLRIEMAVRQAGAWGVKLTGAGAGGCLLTIGPPDQRAAIEDAAREADGQVLEWLFDFDGVRVTRP